MRGIDGIDLVLCSNITDAAVIMLAEGCAGLKEIHLSHCFSIADAAVIVLAEHCGYLEDVDCSNTKGAGTGHQLIREATARPKPAPLPEGSWLEEDVIGPPWPRDT